MNDRLPVLFGDVGASCDETGQLGDAFVELARQVPADRINEALCSAQPDRWGLCPICGHMFTEEGHPPGCPPWDRVFAAVRVVIACWRATRWCARSVMAAVHAPKERP